MRKLILGIVLLMTINFVVTASETSVVNTDKAYNVSDIISYLQKNMPQYLKDQDISGASAVIVNKNGILWTKGFGHLSKNSKEAVNPETLFCVGSISKMFTTTGILIASQNGKIDINKSIKYYLPKFIIKSRFSNTPTTQMTILDLLGFRSGITGSIQNDKESPLLKQDIKDLENSWLRFPVGQRFAYSNPGYSLAGYILAQIEKTNFSKCIKKLVFSPLGMNSTTFDNTKIKKDKNRAIGYIPGVKKIYFTERPNGSAFSNAVDIGKFLKFQLNNGSINGKQLLSDKNINLTRTILNKGKYQNTGFALPDVVDNTSEGTLYRYSGLYHGYNSLILWYPKEDFGVGILTNKRNGLNNNFIPFLKYIYSKLGLNNYFNNYGKIELKKIITKSISLKELKSWVGNYIDTGEGPIVTITFKNNQIGILQNNKFDKLTYIGDNKFYSVKDEKLYKFIKGGKEYPKYILDMSNGGTWNYNDGPNLQKGPDKPEWSKYVGNYNITYYNRPTLQVKFFIKNGYLYLHIFGGNLRLLEYKPGIFVTCSGHIIDFTSKPMLSNNCKMVKINN